MITLTITIEETEERKLSIKSNGIGDATELEVETAMEIRATLNALMEEIGSRPTTEKYNARVTEPKMTPLEGTGTN